MDLKKDEMMKRFRKMEPGLFDSVKRIQSLPEMVEANQKLQKFETELKAKRIELGNVYGGVSMPDAKYSIEEDARKLLDGASLDSLTSPSTETKRGQLTRQKNAIQLVIKMQQAAIQTLHRKLARETCEKVKDFAKRYEVACIDAFENLERALQAKEIFIGFLNLRGCSPEHRPAEWVTVPFESQLLNGGGGIPRLGFHVAERRKVWQLDGKTKTKKVV